MKNKKTPLWYYLILFLLPFLLIGLLEIGLRLFNYGKDLSTWVDSEQNRLMLNPDISARYFTNIKDYPHSNNDTFDKIKKNNTFRIFVLGGSTTAGFPFSPNGSFPRYLKEYLEHNYPKKHFEVVNLGITAVNSFTVLDLIDDVVTQSPDLIILYMGHNEYYGALGVASTERIVNSPALISTYISLSNYRTFQLVKNILISIMDLFSSNDSSKVSQTLMSRMAEEQKIDFESETYKKGVNQFRENLEKILVTANQNRIPVITGTLVSNLRNQKPFIPTQFDGLNANELYTNGTKLLSSDQEKAKELFTKAKELDGLRFRAPEEFNSIIKSLTKKYNSPTADIKNVFENVSPYQIVGKNLMVDHLHPNLKGYQLMGKSFYEKILELNLLPQRVNTNTNDISLDSIISDTFPFTKLDSISSNYRIKNLTSNWPFTNSTKITPPKRPIDKIEQLGYDIVYKNLNWREAHQKAYRWYYSKKDYKNFAKEIRVLLSQYPYKLDYYNFAAQKLLQAKQYNFSLYFLNRKNDIAPDNFTLKWLGNIWLKNKNYEKAIEFYLKSLNLNPNDSQTLHNIGLTYYRLGQLENAIKYLSTNLKINPNNSNTKLLLKTIYEHKRESTSSN